MPSGVFPQTLTDDQSEQWKILRRFGASPAATQLPIWLPSDGYDPDVFTITGPTDTDHVLTYLPLGLNQVTLNGNQTLEYNVDFTVDYTTGTVSLITPVVAGNWLTVWYVTTGELIAATLDPETDGFSDDFNRADSSTTLGSPWSTFATGTDTTNGWNTSTWGISSNRAYLTALATDGLGDVATAIAYIEGDSADGQLDVDITTAPGVFDDIAAFRIDPSLGTPANRSAYIVTKGALFWVAPGVGGAQVGSNFSTAFSSGNHLTVILSGGSVDIQRNGSSVYTNTLANNLTMTKHGIAATDVSARFDNFEWAPA